MKLSIKIIALVLVFSLFIGVVFVVNSFVNKDAEKYYIDKSYVISQDSEDLSKIRLDMPMAGVEVPSLGVLLSILQNVVLVDLTFTENGRMDLSVQLKTESITTVTNSLDIDFDIGELLGESLDLEPTMNTYIHPLFPGVDLSSYDNAVNSLEVLKNTIGLHIIGVTDCDTKEAKDLLRLLTKEIEYDEDTFKLPEYLGLRVNLPYYCRDGIGADGKPYQGIYAGLHDEENSDSYLIMTKYKENGYEKIKFRIEMAGLELIFSEDCDTLS